MKKIMFASVFCLLTVNVFAAGLDLTFFGYKICDFSFDANPFSREDGRSSGVYISHCAPQYYTPPPVRTCATTKTNTRSDERSIVIKDSSNVTVINHENQQMNRPVYAPSIQTTYPTTQYYYSYPATYTYPVYYSYPYYCRPYYYYRPYYCHPGYYRW